MNSFTKHTIVIGFFLAISAGAIATSGLAWYATYRDATVGTAQFSIKNNDGKLKVRLGETLRDTISQPVTSSVREYTLGPKLGDFGGRRAIEKVLITSDDGTEVELPPLGKEAAGQAYYIAMDPDSDGSVDSVRLAGEFPSGTLTVDYSYNEFDVNSKTASLNVNSKNYDLSPKLKNGTIVLNPEELTDVSSNSEGFYKAKYNVDYTEIIGLTDVTGIEKSVGALTFGNYIQVTFVLQNGKSGDKPIDLAITKADNLKDLIAIESPNSKSNEHYRLSITDNTDLDDSQCVFFYEQKAWEPTDCYIYRPDPLKDKGESKLIGKDEIVDGSEFVEALSGTEAGYDPLPGNQCLVSNLKGGESVTLTLRIWCEGTVSTDLDQLKFCTVNFNIVGYEHH